MGGQSMDEGQAVRERNERTSSAGADEGRDGSGSRGESNEGEKRSESELHGGGSLCR